MNFYVNSSTLRFHYNILFQFHFISAFCEVTVSLIHRLNKQLRRSVLYISFGSMNVPVPEQIAEIGMALLDLKIPFIWSLPSRQHVHLPTQMSQTEGSRVENAYLLLPWAPQRMNFAHSSVGGFLSHCGWNSTSEALAYGVPILAWPMASDQLLNAQWLVDTLGVGLLMHGTGTPAERLVSAREVVETLRRLWGNGSEEENELRKNAQQWQHKIKLAGESGGTTDLEITALSSIL